MQFYRDHDTEKRMAFVKIRDKLIELAKQNRNQKIEEDRIRRIQNMKKWDHYKKAKDKIIEQKTKFRQRQLACKLWVTFALFDRTIRTAWAKYERKKRMQ